MNCQIFPGVKVGIIVMLTGLVEGDLVKCARYWPDPATRSLILGDFEVSRYLTNEEKYEFYSKRKTLLNSVFQCFLSILIQKLALRQT